VKIFQINICYKKTLLVEMFQDFPFPGRLCAVSRFTK